MAADLVTKPARSFVATRRQSSYLSVAGITCFTLPLFTIPHIDLVGTLMFADIIVLLLLPAMLLLGRANWQQPFLKPLLIFICLWFAGAVVSDLVNHSQSHDFLRGWANIILFGFFILAIFVLTNGRRERFFMLLLGVAISHLLGWIWDATPYQQGSFFGLAWKFGNGLGVTMLLCLALGKSIKGKYSSWVKGAAIAAFSAVHLFLNTRALFLITFIVGALSSFSFRVSSPKKRLAIGIAVAATAILSVPAFEQIYGDVVDTGILGQAALTKYRMQTAGGESLLLGGRSEILISSRAIMDSPIIGHGSWAHDISYAVRYYQLLTTLGKKVDWSSLSTDSLIPTHSHLFGAWVDQGILGAAFWVYALSLFLRALLSGTLGNSRAEPVELLLITFSLWAIPFSPFGLSDRFYMAVNLAVAANVLRRQGELHREYVRRRNRYKSRDRYRHLQF